MSSYVYRGVIKEGVKISEIFTYNNLYAFIFQFMYSYLVDAEINLPAWMQTREQAQLLDLQYCMVHSGDKKLNRSFYNIFKMKEDDEIFIPMWINLLLNKFSDKWEKEYAALTASYKPLENYDSVEEITRSGDDKVSTNVNMDATGYDKAFNSSDLETVSKSHTEGTGTNNYSKTDWNSKIKTEKTEFDLGELVKYTFEGLDLEMKKKSQTGECFVTSDVPLVFADKNGIERVVLNILTNSIKYTPEGGNIKIYVGFVYNDAYIKVIDNGIGIPEEDLNRIFDRFYRVDKARTREMGGTGLGLSIAKEILDQNNGSIDIKSEKGKGTEVVIRIPTK